MNAIPKRIKLHFVNGWLEWPKIIPLFQTLFLYLALVGCQMIEPEAVLESTTLTPIPTRPVVALESPLVTATPSNTAIPITPSPVFATPSPTVTLPTPSPTITLTPTPLTVDGFLLYGVVVDEEGRIYALQPGSESHFVSTGQMLPGQALSPDGTMLIIDTNDRSQPPLSPEKVFMLSLETGEKSSMNLLAHPRSGIFWSADGNSLLYIDNYSSDDTDQLILYDLVSGENQVLVEVEHILVTAGWSEDGETIAYVAESNGQFDLYIVNSNTLEKQQLTNNPDIETLVLWSPIVPQLLVGTVLDERSAFEGWPWGVENLYLFDPSSNEWQLLVEKWLGSESVSWSPNGKQIVFTDIDSLCILDLEMMVDICPLAEVEPYNEYYISFVEPPIWSDDGNWLAFRAYNGRCRMIYFLELETNTVVSGDLGCDISMVVPLSRLYWSMANWDMFSEQFP
jgi:Tol biopolymer transport system component